MEPKISVIIPAYNGGATIGRCIESVIGQSLRELEIIIIDDGSSDNTYDIASSYAEKDGRIRVIRQEHMGQGAARNAGMDCAAAEYIGFVDCDDTIEPEMYLNMLERIEQSGADVVQCNILDVFENGTKLIQLPIFEQDVAVFDRRKYFSEYVFRNLHSSECCNKLVRAELIKNHGIRFRKNSEVFAEDLLFNLELALHLKSIAFLGDTYYNYYQHSSSHSKQNGEGKILLLFNLFEIFGKKLSDPGLIAETGNLATLIILINLSHILDTDAGRAFARQILKRRDLRLYIRYSLKCLKRPHQKLIMLLLLMLPVNARVFLVKLYYENMK
jgi:glycosyltransferase involved in cell wall biosynthesis